MRRATSALALAALVALVGFGIFAWQHRVDSRASARYGQRLRSLLALEHRLTAEVMKARAGLVAHYDHIVQTVAARKRLHAALRELPSGLFAEDAASFQAQLQRSERARAGADQLVERFKRENAVLRNSLRFLPVLAAELDKLPASPGADARTIFGQLIRDELLLQSWPDHEVSARIDRALARLEQLGRGAISIESAELMNLVAHARIVREKTPLVQRLTKDIASTADVSRTEALLTTFLQRQKAAQQTADRDASVCFCLILTLLIASAASVILGLRRSAAVLRTTSDRLKEALDSLRIEQAKQRELSELKSRFVSMASHEFRTPLSVLVSSSELLEAYGERWPLAKKQEHFLRIRQAAAGMTRMLEGILTIDRHNAGLLRFEPKLLDTASFCEDVVESVATATGQGKRIVYTGPAREDQVVADPNLLRHVLENLLSNALKYSPDSSEVQLSVAREGAQLRFDVRDRGIGISADDQPRLFETFHRGNNVGAIAGTGLGLAIVRGAVELHGGTVAVESELHAGTHFTVRIPCGASAA